MVWENKGVYTLLKGICLKGNIIVLLELKPTCFGVAVHHFSQHTAMTPEASYELSNSKYTFYNIRINI